MGYADRDYYREGPARPVSRFADIPVVKWLLISNGAIFLLGVLFRPNATVDLRWEMLGVYSIDTALQQFQVWRFITFQFLHANFMHVLFNMWALWVFGPYLERWWKSRPFLVFYLLCGIGGALFYTFMVYWPGFFPPEMVGARLLGASAGIFGILVGVAVLAPQARIRLMFPPIAMTMRTFALVFLGIEVFLLLSHSANAGGSAGHLGGALAGFLLIKVPALRGALVKLANMGGIKVTRTPKPGREVSMKKRPRTSMGRSDSPEVDRILDKISREGLQSLTDAERELLRKAAGK